MKILLATYWLLPHVGGVWVYIQDLKARLEKLGHEVEVLARHPDDKSYYILNTNRRVEKKYFKQLVSREIKAIYASQPKPIDPWIVDQEIEFCCYALAAAYFGLQHYDLIHTQDVISSRALWQIKPEHVPLINTIHGCLATDYIVSLEGKAPSATIWKYACAREYYGATSSDLAIVPTHWLQRTQGGYMVPQAHMRVVPYGLDIESYSWRMNQATSLSLPSNVRILVCPARLDKVKGHSCLLDALYKLKQLRSDWICLFVGDGNLRSELEAKAARLELQHHVKFTGSRADVPAILQRSDIVILPSLNDNQPYAVMEAQISRKPIVVSDAGGIPEMVTHGLTGLMARAGDSDELSLYLLCLLENEALRQSVASGGYNWGISQWSIHTMIARTTALYTELLNNRGIRKVSHPPKHPGRHGLGICTWLRTNQNMYIPSAYSIVDDHIVGSILF
ncbi:glycosyltransferase family 4 protein [Paenibacillus sp. NPDC058174]|uniref:glycosyltransferase family 4 protein n=1 Tax=Paenibacillus sp. NPDC058174 TaxID=3346366 RepID=UPI0036D8A4EF